MSTNKYFDSNYISQGRDQDLFEDLIIESIFNHGRDYFYLPRKLNNFDEFFGEDSESIFDEAVKVEMYLENVQGWEGEQDFISKFGLEIRDEATLIVSKKRFKETVGFNFDLETPKEGDIIVFPKEVDYLQRAYEISFVEDEPIFYQLGQLCTWKLKVRLFEYNGEEFNTGIDSIDDYNNYASSQAVSLDMGTGVYEIGEYVTQGDNFKAVVLDFNEDEKILILSANKSDTGEAYNPEALIPIIGENSNANWIIKDIENDNVNVPIADNSYLDEVNEDLIIKEHNPFSGL